MRRINYRKRLSVKVSYSPDQCAATSESYGYFCVNTGENYPSNTKKEKAANRPTFSNDGKIGQNFVQISRNFVLHHANVCHDECERLPNEGQIFPKSGKNSRKAGKNSPASCERSHEFRQNCSFFRIRLPELCRNSHKKYKRLHTEGQTFVLHRANVRTKSVNKSINI